MPFRPSQADFKGRGDTVGLNVDTFDYGAHVNFTRARDTAFRIRFLIQEVGGVSDTGTAYKLRASLSGGTYQDVTSSSTIAKLVLSGQYADKDATSSNLLGGSGSYVNGQGLESSTSTDSLALTASNKMELEFCLQINSADVALSQYVDFRVYRGTSTVMYSYTYTPRVYPLQTITGAGALASAEAFGSATVSAGGSTQNITGAGAVASIVAFGTAKLSLRVAPSGLASIVAFGTAKLNLKITITGIASAEVFGAITVSAGGQAISGAGAMASLQALGSPRKADLLYPGGQLRAVLRDPEFPQVSANGRYLVENVDDPWLILSDSPQGMLACLSTTEMETYFATRAQQGFNASQVHIIAGPTFGGRSDKTTYDSIAPFSTPNDISTPNATYFARLDTLVDLAANDHIVLFLDAAECIDSESLWTNNGNTKCYAWGQYLGNRYKSKWNIVWLVGNDFQDWRTNSAAVEALSNVLDGLRNADPYHLRTAWMDYYVSGSRDSTDMNSRIEVDLGYTYYIAYDKIGTERALSPAKPVWLGETYYENYSVLSLVGTPYILRKQNYWSMLAGACGVTVHNDNWNFHAGWQSDMSLASATEIVHLKDLFEAYSWWNLVPDTTNQVLTAGYGTKRSGAVQPNDANDDYAACAWISDGTLALIYMPENLTMTIDMSKFAGTVTCRWYDPTDGSYTTDAASPHTNTGTHNFSRNTANSTGATDWVLVLTT